MRGGPSTGSHANSRQQTINKRCNSPIMQKSSGELVKLFPTLSVMDMVKQGGIKFGAVQIGGKGDCSNFNLLGKCTDPKCTYAHRPAKVGKERQVVVAKSVNQAVAKMKGASPA